jgi:hypothetical protein
MSRKFPAAWTASAIACLFVSHVWAEDTAAPNPNAVPSQSAAAPQSNVSPPDACKLLPQSDLEALFPGKTIISKGPTLSPLYKGPQYNERCMYIVKLPSPTSTAELSKFVTINVVQWGDNTSGSRGAAPTFASLRSTQEKITSVQHHIEDVKDVGDEAFTDSKSDQVKVYVRKADLVYILNIDVYSPQSMPNALALATQAAKRWEEVTGMVETSTPVVKNTNVDIPADTRTPDVASVDKWPDACALLTPEDVQAVFGDMKIEPPQRTMGKITYHSRVDRTEALPKPIRCFYQTSRPQVVNGERTFITHSVTLIVANVAANVDLSKRYYAAARKVLDASTDVEGLGDEASFSASNVIYIRKGILVISVAVGGGDRDRVVHDDATRRVNALAKLVARKLADTDHI